MLSSAPAHPLAAFRAQPRLRGVVDPIASPGRSTPGHFRNCASSQYARASVAAWAAGCSTVAYAGASHAAGVASAAAGAKARSSAAASPLAPRRWPLAFIAKHCAAGAATVPA